MYFKYSETPNRQEPELRSSEKLVRVFMVKVFMYLNAPRLPWWTNQTKSYPNMRGDGQVRWQLGGRDVMDSLKLDPLNGNGQYDILPSQSKS